MNPTSISLDRVPPQSVEAEQAVLGALLLDREAIHRALEVLERNSFYRVSHRQIFAVVLALYERDDVVDLVTVAEELQRNGELEAVGGPVYLQTLVSSVATVANVVYHARIVQEKALLRQLIQTAAEVTHSAYEGGDSSEEILDRAEQAIFRISESRLRQSFVPVDQVLRDTFERIEKLHERKHHVTGVETGFMDLDVKTAGFQPGDFVVIAGRPGMGKTSFMLNVAQHAAIKNKVPVALFSLEMSKEQLVLRLLCSEARVSGHKVRTGFLGESDWPRLTSSAGRLSEAPIYIDDTPTLTVLEMRAKSRRLKAETSLGMIVVDYLQLVRSSQQMENRQQEISHISRSLKALARELELPVVVGSQLSRAVESRGGEKRPQLSDLRECVTGDTRVMLADGRAVPIRRLVGEAPEVLAVSADGRIVTARSDLVWSVGRRPVFDVRLASGRVVRATAQHRLLHAEGWRRISMLAAGEALAVAGSSGAAPATGRVGWDRVEAIQPAGEEEVFDLTVPGPASWLADGIVSHNSGAIEQDADTVVFIYRPEVYERTTENEGRAEIILAKQRNGPIGDLPLTFIDEYTRFENMVRQSDA